MSKKRDRFFHAPRLPHDGVPRKVPEGKFIWHNQVQRCVGMSHGLNGFRCWYGELPIDYRQFERCRCGWIELAHYKRRGAGGGTRVSWEQVLRNGGMSPKQIKALAEHVGAV